MRFLPLAFAFAFSAIGPARATIPIVAAENFYGAVAKQIGGDQVSVTSILSNPDQDPHLFTVDPNTARAVEDADVIVLSGIDYDPWMAQLEKAHRPLSKTQKQFVITVSDLIGAKEGDNPHIWYQPEAMPAYAKRLAEFLCANDKAHAADYQKRLADFLATLQPVQAKIAALKARFGGTDVLATEPVFGYMADALGFKMHDMGFQNHVMNNVEPTARETEEFESLLKGHKVKILFYNGQASDPVASRMQDIAKASGIPVVGVTETEPAGTTYASWMLLQLDAVEKALAN
jgi:zinc/manganese transport system substrate-binding protein